jgi:hypothetical protein
MSRAGMYQSLGSRETIHLKRYMFIKEIRFILCNV